MDDDKDGGIEVDESDEVGGTPLPGFSFNLQFSLDFFRAQPIFHYFQCLWLFSFCKL